MPHSPVSGLRALFAAALFVAPWTAAARALGRLGLRRPTARRCAAWGALGALSLMVMASMTLGGCRSEGQTFVVEAALVGNATEGYGPYEVLVRINGTRAIERAQLRWVASDRPDASPATVYLDPSQGQPDVWRGVITARHASNDEGTVRVPFALGTRVDYWIEITPTDGPIARAPLEAPDEAYSFEIGPNNQPIALQSVSPPRGPSSGGERVFLGGEGFRADTEVIFQTQVATEVIYRSAHLLEVITPASPAGPANVTVRNPAGATSQIIEGYFFVPAPNPQLVAPDRGPTTGGTPIVIIGLDFEPGATVQLGDQPLPDAVVQSPTRITATTRPHPEGPVALVVTNPDGQSGTLSEAYTYQGPPEVLSVDPDIGPTEGNTDVIVTGGGFLPGARVRFDDRDAVVLDVTDTAITARTPPHPAGTVDVTVTNPDGQSDTGEGLYTYLAPPELLEVDPNEGTTLGGDRVTLRGGGFFEGMTATFDGLPCDDLVVLSPQEATCTTPPHPEGPVDVTISVAGRSDTLRGGFTYLPPPPEILTIEPDRGPDTGGTTVTLTVRHLQPNPSVRFDDLPAASIVSVSFDGDIGTLVVITPPHPEGFATVTVTNRDAQSDARPEGFFFVGPPVIEAITPDEGPDTGGQTVTITGRNFVEGMTVTFDGLPAEVVSVDPDTGTIVVRTPPHPVGTVDVTVTAPDGRFDVARDGYTYIILPPSIDRIVPSEGPVWGGNTVIVEGQGFREGVVVFVGGVTAQVTRIDGGRLEVVIPGGADDGTVDLEVRNPDAQSDAAPYTYVSPTFEPSTGLTPGFTTVTVTGLGLDAGTQVSFGGVPAERITFIDETTLLAVTPRALAGTGPVAVNVVTSSGRGVEQPAAFTYQAFIDATDPAGIPSDPDCLALGAADLDGDGDAEVVVANGSLFTDAAFFPSDTVYYNDPGLTFTPLDLGREENAMNVDFADIDLDGDTDMLIANLNGVNRLWRNDGPQNLTDVTSVALPLNRQSYDAGFIDLDGDANLDVIYVNTGERDNLFRNRGNGRFEDVSDRLPSGNLSEHDHDYARGDLDGDGREDFIVSVDNTVETDLTRRYDAVNRVFVTGGDATFERAEGFGGYTDLDGDFLEAAIVDVDLDGLNDIVVIDNIDQSSPLTVPETDFVRNTTYIYRNLGNGQFAYATDLTPQNVRLPAFSFTVTDIDNDGDPDLLISNFANVGDVAPINPTGQPNLLYLNRGDGFYRDGSDAWPALRDLTADIEPVDFDNDGLEDLYICNYLTPNRLYLRTPAP